MKINDVLRLSRAEVDTRGYMYTSFFSSGCGIMNLVKQLTVWTSHPDVIDIKRQKKNPNRGLLSAPIRLTPSRSLALRTTPYDLGFLILSSGGYAVCLAPHTLVKWE